MKNIISYGAGLNSTAMVIDMINHNIQIDAIVFADTGGERPETYQHLAQFNNWLLKNAGIEIEIIKGFANIGKNDNVVLVDTLEKECLLRKQLPAIIYGTSSCSDKWKKQPFKRWLKSKNLDDEITMFLGFDAGEPYRAERGELINDGYKKRYWLIERGLFRKDCIEIIKQAGITPPGKSSCFFCPSMKKHEILSLPADLKNRAIALENNADLTVLKGLGRSWSWKNLIEFNDAQTDLFDTTVGIPCDCWDGK